MKLMPILLVVLPLTLTVSVQAQTPARISASQGSSTAGTLVIIPAFGEIGHANDQVVATLAIEEQDKDKTVAASRVNQKMKQGIAIIKQQDPQASLKTQGYYTFAVYGPELPNAASSRARVPLSWRVGQTVQVTSSNLEGLPKTVAQAQRVLTLNGLQFGLSPATRKKLDAQRIAASYQNLIERISSIAAAMGRLASDAVIETVDYEGSGAYAEQNGHPAAPMMMLERASSNAQAPVEEPSFEPGETTLQMQLVGKVRFK